MHVYKHRAEMHCEIEVRLGFYEAVLATNVCSASDRQLKSLKVVLGSLRNAIKPRNKRKQLHKRQCVDICDEAFDDAVRNRNVR